ncbi:hypothetical protein [Cerasicoccus frondis]|uniref:hypothetical protein n=1 Tax=Cerasicoccus frondis TaxID=490090 RepID=UPI00285299D6|nr:hypothetical protein [Cerasicoccus frondis]
MHTSLKDLKSVAQLVVLGLITIASCIFVFDFAKTILWIKSFNETPLIDLIMQPKFMVWEPMDGIVGAEPGFATMLFSGPPEGTAPIISFPTYYLALAACLFIACFCISICPNGSNLLNSAQEKKLHH